MKRKLYTGLFCLLLSVLITKITLAQPTSTTPITAIVDIDGNGSRDYVYVIGADVWINKAHNGTYLRYPGLGANRIYTGVFKMDAGAANRVLFIQRTLSGTTYTYTLSVLYTAVVNGPVLKKAVAVANTSLYAIQIRDMDGNAGDEVLFHNSTSAALYTFTTNAVWRIAASYASATPAPVTVPPFFAVSNLGPGRGVLLIFVYYYSERLFLGSNHIDWNYLFCRIYNARTKTLTTWDPGVVGQKTVLWNNNYNNQFCAACKKYFSIKDHVSATSQARMIFSLEETACQAGHAPTWAYTSYNLETGALNGVAAVSKAVVDAARTTDQAGVIYPGTDEDLADLRQEDLIPVYDPPGSIKERGTIIIPDTINTIPRPVSLLVNAGEMKYGTIEGEADTGEFLLIHPNPFTDKLMIQTTHKLIRTEISDITGRVVYRDHGGKYRLSITGLKPGVYFYRIETGNGIHTGKLVRQ